MTPLGKVDYDVAIVGLGPVGAVLGNFLGAAGLDVAIFERDAEILQIPRAVAFDGEIMRVFQAIDLADVLHPILRASTGAQFIDPAGKVMLRRAPADEDGPQGWKTFYNFHQPKLEKTLRDGLARYSNVAVDLRHDVYAIDAHANYATLHIEAMATGKLREVTAKFVVGCDGARSLVRRLIGSELEDLGLHEPWVVADFELKRDVPVLPEISTQYCDPHRPVTYVHVVENRRRLEFKLPPGADLRDAASAENVWAMASRWFTHDDADLTRAALYTFHSLLAKEWSRGPLLIAGDSAHQTPPFLGQGLCAGIRDAANLAWKLERVLRMGAPTELLDSYGPERRAHAHAFIDMAVQLGHMLGARNVEEMHQMTSSLGGRSGGPNALVYPVPHLGEGLFDGSAGAGKISPQPRLADNRKLDDLLGYRFGLIATADFLDHLDALTRTELSAAAIVVVKASGAIEPWLAELQCAAVLLRPDRYVWASFQDVSDLTAFWPKLARLIGKRSYAEC